MLHPYTEAEREAVYRTIRERRDVRRFSNDPIPEETLYRLLCAAAQAPSVGYMQPWNFILIRNLEVRKEIHQAFLRANDEAQKMFDQERADQYRKLKLEGILESTLNLCVTCDRSRFGPVVLGRTCQPEMDLFSAVCAVQNFWLAARAEGIAVGWVSIIEPDDIKRILKLPDKVVPVAYLCVGHTRTFEREPELKTSGWLPQLDLDDLIFEGQWGIRRNPIAPE